MREEIIESTTREVVATFAASRSLVNHEDMKEILDERFNHDYLALMFDREDTQILSVLGFMGLTANYSSEEGLLIIGDSPVLAVRNSVEGKPSLRNTGSQVILPISSKCLLVYLWTTRRNLLDKGGVVDKEQVLTLNRDYYHESNCRFLYGRTRNALEQSRMLPLQWTPRTRSMAVADGWHAMQSQLQEQDDRNRVEEAAYKEELLGAVRQVVERARVEQSRRENAIGHGDSV